MQVENLTVFILKLGYCELSYNAVGLPTLVVGECPLGHVTVGTRLLSNRSD